MMVVIVVDEGRHQGQAEVVFKRNFYRQEGPVVRFQKLLY